VANEAKALDQIIKNIDTIRADNANQASYSKFLLKDKKLKKIKEKLRYDPDMFYREPRSFVEGTRAQAIYEIDQWAGQNGNPSILLITGLPGSGKSTLVDMWANLRQQEKKEFLFGARICFTGQGQAASEQDKATFAKSVLSTIAVQLLENTCSKQALERMYMETTQEDIQLWTLEQHIEKEFILLANILSREVQRQILIIIIDALDECLNKKFLNTLKNIALTKLPSNFKMLLTSRADRDISLYFPETQFQPLIRRLNLNEAQGTEQDIAKFIRTKIKQENYFEQHNNFSNEENIQQLINVAGGVFLCAKTIICKFCI